MIPAIVLLAALAVVIVLFSMMGRFSCFKGEHDYAIDNQALIFETWYKTGADHKCVPGSDYVRGRVVVLKKCTRCDKRSGHWYYQDSPKESWESLTPAMAEKSISEAPRLNKIRADAEATDKAREMAAVAKAGQVNTEGAETSGCGVVPLIPDEKQGLDGDT